MADTTSGTYEINAPADRLKLAWDSVAARPAITRPCCRVDKPYASPELKCESTVERDALVWRRRVRLAAMWSCAALAFAFVAVPMWVTWTWSGARVPPLLQSPAGTARSVRSPPADGPPRGLRAKTRRAAEETRAFVHVAVLFPDVTRR